MSSSTRGKRRKTRHGVGPGAAILRTMLVASALAIGLIQARAYVESLQATPGGVVKTRNDRPDSKAWDGPFSRERHAGCINPDRRRAPFWIHTPDRQDTPGPASGPGRVPFARFFRRS
jgi:hypothetical protein